MIYRILSGLFSAAAFGIFFCLIVFSFVPSNAEPGLMVEQPNRVFNTLVAGRDYDVAFRIHNRSRRTLRIVGMGIT